MEPHGEILIVEDDAGIRQALRDLLLEEGFRVLEAQDGAEALAIVARMSNPPCVVLLDLMMPRMTGWEVLRAWEADGSVDSHRVCIISAYSDRAPPTVHRVFRKPLDVRRLLETVQALC